MRVFGIIATMGLISCSEDKNVDSNVDGTNDSDTESPVVDVQRSFETSSDVLINSGVGFANYHYGWWCNLPPISFTPEECVPRVEENWPDNHPDAGTSYFRWTWADLEPERGQINFELIDTTLQTSNLLGETLGFRVMTILEGGMGVPEWLTQEPYSIAGQSFDGTFWPDVRDTTFLSEHQRFLAALGERYDGHPAMDHVDIGTVGCWGEWNTACVSEISGLFDFVDADNTSELDDLQSAYTAMIDHHLDAFVETPTIMLGIGHENGRNSEIFKHATSNGAGWRLDCWGDWGIWGDNWMHHRDYYPQFLETAAAQNPDFTTLYRRAPIHLEVCGVMNDWEGLGWGVEAPNDQVTRTMDFAVEQHASLFNAKFSSVPESYSSEVERLLSTSGYRLALSSVQHTPTIEENGVFKILSVWINNGNAPMYHQRALTWRVSTGSDAWYFISEQDLREWYDGTHERQDTFELPADVRPGVYSIEVALLDRDGTNPATTALPPTRLANVDQKDDGWMPVSTIEVVPAE